MSIEFHQEFGDSETRVKDMNYYLNYSYGEIRFNRQGTGQSLAGTKSQ